MTARVSPRSDARGVCHARSVPGPDDLSAELTDATALAVIRSAVARSRESLDSIESALQSLDRQRRSTERARPLRFYNVLVGVYEHGVHGIDDQSLTDLATANGYQRRGLNGFFTGARAALRRSAGRVVLTPEGHRLLDNYLSQLQP